MSKEILKRQSPGSASTSTKGSTGGAFITVWKVKPGEEIAFIFEGSFTIDWGDGHIEKINDNNNVIKHKYVNSGLAVEAEYTVSISAGITGFSMLDWTSENLVEIKQWGAAQWESAYEMFNGAYNMVCTATDAPDLSKLKNMRAMFASCEKFNSPIEHWDFSTVENVFCMLNDTPAFDQDLRLLEVCPGEDGEPYVEKIFGSKKSLATYNEQYGVKEDKRGVLHALEYVARVTP